MSDNTRKLISRKFTISVLGLLLATGLIAFKVIDATAYVTCVGICVGGYLTANVWEAK